MCGPSYYVFWLLAPIVLSAVTQHPVVAGVAVVGFLCRRWLPDPFLYFKYSGRIATLTHEVAANPHNASAQRELALIYLEKRRPAKAVCLLEAALEREPESADLLYHHGCALLGSGRDSDAVERLVAAVTHDPRLAYGDPYLKAGDALMKLGRLDDAEEAFERAAKVNGSSVEARFKSGVVFRTKRDQDRARAAFMDARSTYRQLPTFQKRKAWWWAFRAWTHS
jgi:tetratricopeptide (TPR) repeat protein